MPTLLIPLPFSPLPKILSVSYAPRSHTRPRSPWTLIPVQEQLSVYRPKRHPSRLSIDACLLVVECNGSYEKICGDDDQCIYGPVAVGAQV